MRNLSLEQSAAAESSEERVQRHQGVRMNRLAMSAVSYALQLAIVGSICVLSQLEPIYFLGYAFCSLLIVGGFYAMFRWRWNLYFRYPSLALPQVIAPVLPSMILLYQLQDAQAQAAILITAVVPLVYGLFDLSSGRFIIAGLVYALGYLAVLLTHSYFHPGDPLFRHNWVLIISVSVVMAQIGLIGGFINHLRRALRSRNEQLKQAMHRISVMAVHDDLTGIYNRRWLMDVLDKERQRLDRGEHAFSVCLLDIDYFKEVNDQYGHGVGDRVLAGLAEAISTTVRDIDTFGRLGGEEFLWVMPDQDLEQAREAAERVLAQTAALRFRNGQGGELSVTVSMGVAHCNVDNRRSSETLMRIADQALYKAKERGRNRVVCAPDNTQARGSTRLDESGIACTQAQDCALAG
ncbi:MAG: GGDEF domain-containing protein [Salinisphaera sp.]|nr:GGDEF domain-containing protein [Salinisphaera sp.]